MPAEPIRPFPDGAFRRVLCVVAHPDDVEYGASSAVAAWTADGVEVAYLLLTRGEAGMNSSPPERTAELRMREQVAGSSVVGVSKVDFLEYPDGVLAALDAVRDAGNLWVFPELLEEDLEPCSVRWLLVAGDPRPTHGVDVTGDALERGIASLEAHSECLAGIPGHPPVRAMITGITAMQGRGMGAPNAVLFRAFDFHSPPPIALQAMQAVQTEHAAPSEG